jgi:tetratricopeptide (TPR) repeat protein
LRRLLDINQGWLYRQWSEQLRGAGKRKEARDAAAKAAMYMPGAGAQFSLGLMDYELGDKQAALAEFRKAIEMDANMRRQFEARANLQPGRGERLRAVLDDKAFLDAVLK